MASEVLMGLDIGGGGGRCLVINPSTGTHATAYRAWRHPRAPEYGHWAFDLDLDFLWRVVGEVAREAMARAGVAAGDVAGVAVTSMRHGMVVVDKAGDVLLATPNQDARAAMDCMSLGEERCEEFYRRTGHWPCPIFAAPRLMWLAGERPGDLQRAHAVMSISDWAGYRLTGTIAVERSQAAEMMVLDLHTREWADDLIALLALPRHVFPALADAGSKLGGLTETAAGHLGLVQGTPVAMGGADSQCGLLGVGAARPGQLAAVAGTTTPVMLTTDQPIIDAQKRLWTGLHVVPGLYVLESSAGAMGSALDWMARVWYPDAANPVAQLCAQAGLSAPGAGGILSSVGTQVFDASALSLPVDNLTFSAASVKDDAGGSAHTARAHMARSILEGMAYAVRANAEQVQAASGTGPDGIWLTGGMTRSATWTQMIGDVLGCPARVGAMCEATALGAAICAGAGAGLYPDLVAGADALVDIAREHSPDQVASRTYRDLYAAWQALRERQAGADMHVADLIVQGLMDQPAEAGAQAEIVFRPRIYVSADLDKEALDQLRELGDVTYANYRTEGKLLVGEDLWETLAGYHILVTVVDMVDAEALQKLPDLRLIAVCRGNPVNIDVAACTAAGVPVVNTPGRNAGAVADLTVSFMLMLARKMPGAMAFLREPGGEAGDMGRMGMAYEQLQGHELWRKTAGLIGAGAVGRDVIKRLLPFGMQILVYDPYLGADQALLLGVEKVELDYLLAQSDFVSLHAPVTDETRGMIDAGALAAMKEGSFLINTARAALVDEQALIAALESGRLGGAALDVFSIEPPAADDPLLALPNVIATPHVGGNTHEVAAHQGAIVAGEVRRLLTGEPPRHTLNRKVLAGFGWTGERKMSQEALQELSKGPGPGVSDLQVEAQEERMSRQARPAPARKPGPAVKDMEATAQKPQARVVPAEPKKEGLFSRLRKRVSGAGEQAEAAPLAAGAPPAAGSGGAQHEMMVRILELFTAGVAHDPKMAEFSQGKDVTMLFTLRDMAQDFYLSFVEGQVDAALGQPPGEPDVYLKMNAAILDGMFTGKVNGMRAAMTGKLSFSGDTSKAMAFQRLQGDMGRLYQSARDTVGDPGDLAKIGVAAQAPVQAPAAPQPAAAAVPAVAGPAIVEVGDVRDDILKVMRDLYAKGIITPTGGNISARVDGNPNEVWITPSAVFKGDLRPDMMVRVDLEGKVLSDNGYSASSERLLHCAVYQRRPEVEAVIHSHAPQATLMAMTGTRFLPISTEAAFLGDIPVVQFGMPGTPDLGEVVAEAMGEKGFAVLMQNHGLVVAGSSVRRAADMTHVAEVTAETILACRVLGVEPPVLPDDIVETLREMGAMLA